VGDQRLFARGVCFVVSRLLNGVYGNFEKIIPGYLAGCIWVVWGCGGGILGIGGAFSGV
jgi:hypothetical protein